MKMNQNNNKWNSHEKSEGEMLSEILRLLLKLFLKCIIKLCQLILKGLQLFIRTIKVLGHKCIDFWNDNSTQEKVHKTELWCQNTLRATIKYSVIGIKLLGIGLFIVIKAICLGLIRFIKTAIKGIIHLQPTIILIGKVIVNCNHAILKWFKRCGRGFKYFFVKRKKTYKTFRRNKGFKGLLIDTKNYLQYHLNSYMDEGHENENSDAISYEEYLNEHIESNGKPETLGKKIYIKMNKLIDNE